MEIEKRPALIRTFKKTVEARVERDPAFRDALLTEALEQLLGGEAEVGKSILRDDIFATIGLQSTDPSW